MESKDIFMPSGNQRDLTVHLEQYVVSVLECSSMYNSSFSISYAPEGIVGQSEIYPSYGDFPETYILRTYGSWWQQSEMYQNDYMPQDVDPLRAEDYIVLGFETAVLPRHVCIYETYNPGAVTRIWGRLSRLEWILLWEGPPQVWPHRARVFRPPIKKLNCLINEIRLEFNQSNLGYHTAIDAVLLGGLQPRYRIQSILLRSDLSYWVSPSKITNQVEDSQDLTAGEDPFLRLPNEILLQIFRFLDLVSLSKCAQVCRRWNKVSKDSTMIQNLSLKRYWHRITSKTIRFLERRCKNLKKLDMSWCIVASSLEDPIDEILLPKFPNFFIGFLDDCCKQLTHLSLSHTSFVTSEVIEKITYCTEITELRLKAVNLDTNSSPLLARFEKLVTLDLSWTSITDSNLISILKANPNLKNINLDFCGNIQNLDDMVLTASRYNKNLTSWSSWKTVKLTSTGAGYFANFRHLKELDLGWCFVFNDPGDCLKQIASGCRDMRRLIISQWRSINDEMLLSVVTNCKRLKFLDLLGIKSITNDVCEMALRTLPELRMLDISFCVAITDDQVHTWREQYPHVTIQRSFQHVITDYFH